MGRAYQNIANGTTDSRHWFFINFFKPIHESKTNLVLLVLVLFGKEGLIHITILTIQCYICDKTLGSKGLASYCKAETTFTFYFTILPLSKAFLNINNREMKSESGFSLAKASQPLGYVCTPEKKAFFQCDRNRSIFWVFIQYQPIFLASETTFFSDLFLDALFLRGFFWWPFLGIFLTNCSLIRGWGERVWGF